MMPHSRSKFLKVIFGIGTISSSGSTVLTIWAAVPSNIWAASSWALSSITLLVGSHLFNNCLLGNKWAISSSRSTEHTIWAAVPSNIWAASSWALSTITLLLAAILARAVFLATNGQSAAVAAQYMPSGQQYHPTYGQHPPGHSVPSHCLLAAILARAVFLATNGQSAAVAAQYIPSGQQY